MIEIAFTGHVSAHIPQPMQLSSTYISISPLFFDSFKNGVGEEWKTILVHMQLPELKQRREDTPLLIEHIIYKFNRLQNKDIVGVSDEVMAVLINYDYPGNVNVRNKK